MFFRGELIPYPTQHAPTCMCGNKPNSITVSCKIVVTHMPAFSFAIESTTYYTIIIYNQILLYLHKEKRVRWIIPSTALSKKDSYEKEKVSFTKML